MEKWNFDAVFSGTNEEQEIKASRFRAGISERLKEACGRYADAVLSGEESTRRFEQVRQYEEAHEAMIVDPRGVALRAWIEKRDAEKQAEEVKDMIADLFVSGKPRGPRQ